MLVELMVFQIGMGKSWDKNLAEVEAIVRSSTLSYHLTPLSVRIEGNWDEIMTVARQVHEQACLNSQYVMTAIQIEDGDPASIRV